MSDVKSFINDLMRFESETERQAVLHPEPGVYEIEYEVSLTKPVSAETLGTSPRFGVTCRHCEKVISRARVGWKNTAKLHLRKCRLRKLKIELRLKQHADDA